MNKVHGPSFSRATLLYAAAAAAFVWSQMPSGQIGSPPHAHVALMVVAMVAGPVALMNFASIMWGSFKAPRSVPMFMVEMIYAVFLPTAFFFQHIRSFIHW